MHKLTCKMPFKKDDSLDYQFMIFATAAKDNTYLRQYYYKQRRFLQSSLEKGILKTIKKEFKVGKKGKETLVNGECLDCFGS